MWRPMLSSRLWSSYKLVSYVGFAGRQLGLGIVQALRYPRGYIHVQDQRKVWRTSFPLLNQKLLSNEHD